MLKLYNLREPSKEYWEIWKESDHSHIVHWGVLGTQGATKSITAESGDDPEGAIQREIDELLSKGFSPIEPEDHTTLMIEFAVDGMGTVADVDKRHRLQDRMNETLGWTGLGACDGGSIGSGTMEVCNFVVDFDIAMRVIEADLLETEFSDYTRIYREEK